MTRLAAARANLLARWSAELCAVGVGDGTESDRCHALSYRLLMFEQAKTWSETMKIEPITLPQLIPKVHDLIECGGGYWEGLAAIARLLEELGELAYEINIGSTAVAAEAADVLTVVISLCIQYRIDPSRPVPTVETDISSSFQRLVQNCACLARVINHVEGHKPAKAGERFHGIHDRVSMIPVLLGRICSLCDLDLYKTAEAEIMYKTRRDEGRFQVRTDPCCAPILKKLAEAGLIDAPLFSNMIGAVIEPSSLLHVDTFLNELMRFSRIAAFTPDAVLVLDTGSDNDMLIRLQQALAQQIPSASLEQCSFGEIHYAKIRLATDIATPPRAPSH